MLPVAIHVRIPLCRSADHKLYWVDAYTDKVETSNLDGSARKVIAHAPGSHFFDVQVIDDFLYMTDWHSR